MAGSNRHVASLQENFGDLRQTCVAARERGASAKVMSVFAHGKTEVSEEEEKPKNSSCKQDTLCVLPVSPCSLIFCLFSSFLNPSYLIGTST